jgi:hypothetical protein
MRSVKNHLAAKIRQRACVAYGRRRLADNGYMVCGSNGDREWHWHGPDGKWHDGYRSEYAAVKAALRDLKVTKTKKPAPAIGQGGQ